jgi:hypothetical protein
MNSAVEIFRVCDSHLRMLYRSATQLNNLLRVIKAAIGNVDVTADDRSPASFILWLEGS